MSLCTINGVDVLGLELRMPLRGPWFAHADVDAASFAAGPIAVVFEHEGRTVGFYGTAREPAPWEGRTRIFIVGGRGELRRELPAKDYSAGSAAAIVRDLAIESGEKLAPGVEDVLDDLELDSWARAKGSGARALSTLAARLDLGWRVLDSGTVWIGTETWAPVKSVPFEQEGADESGFATYAPDLPELRPGTNCRGRRLSEVVHDLSEAGLRTRARYLPDATSSRDRARDDWNRAVRGAVPELEWLAPYEATVVSQDAAGKLSVQCDSDLVGDLDEVPVYLGLPGCRVKVAKGARVKIGFAEGRPDRRFASLWATNAATLELTIVCPKVTIQADEIYLGEGAARVLREGDPLNLTGVQASPSGATGVVATLVSQVDGPPPAGRSRVRA